LLKRNLVANYLGQGWASFSTFIFVPVYIHYLGLEAYGLIGFFAMLQAWFTLLDAGLGPALGREMARFTGGQHTNESIRDLLRSIETISFVVAVALTLAFWFGSDWIARAWLSTENMPITTVSNSLALMGLVAAIRVIEGVYRSALLGLQKQVLFNYLLVLTSTLKSVGAVIVVSLVNPSVELFFIWQAVASILAVCLLAFFSRRSLPQSNRITQFSWNEIQKVWAYAKGMLAITLLSLLLMQIDKLVLSSTLPLAQFGVYSLAATVAMAILVLVTPISQAWFPRLSQLHFMNDETQLRSTFHSGAQLISVILGSAAIVLFLFAERVLTLWTQNPELSEKAAPLLAVLLVGNLLNGLMWMPYQAQLAHGWTSLSVKINFIAVIVLTPATVWIAHSYGPLEVCLVWVLLNLVYLSVGGKLTFNKILRGEYRTWIYDDMAKPILTALITALAFRLAMFEGLAPLAEILYVGLASATTLVAATFTAPILRKSLLSRFHF